MGLAQRIARRLRSVELPASRDAGILLALILLSLIINGVYLITHPPGPLSGETPHWWPIIRNLADGKGYVACFPQYFPGCQGTTPWPTASREPLPVLLFAGVEMLPGASLLKATVAQALLKTLVMLSVFLLAREFAGAIAARIAALLWILYLPALKLIPQVSGELLAALGLTSALFFLLRGRDTGRLLFYFACGLGVGLAALSRSASLAAGPALLLFGLIRPSPTLRSRTAAGGLLLLGLATPLAPWIIRNYEVFGRPVIGSTLTGYNLYRENYQLADPDYLRFVAGGEAGQAVQRLEEVDPWLEAATSEVEFDTAFQLAASRIILAHPDRYAALCAFRFLLLWFNWGYLQAYGKHPGLLDYAVMGEQALLLILALVGFRRLGLRAAALAASVAAVTLLYMAVIGQLRFVIPLMPLTMTLAAAGLTALGRIGRPRFHHAGG